MKFWVKCLVAIFLFGILFQAVGAVAATTAAGEPGEVDETKASLLFSHMAIAESEAQRQPALRGQRQIVVVVHEADLPTLFPTDAKQRARKSIPAVLTDGESTYLATISPGGQSSLTAGTPNIRVKNLKGKKGNDTKKSDQLAGVSILKQTVRINPMTMDEGYVATQLYLFLLNHFRLTPDAKFPLSGQYAKVRYLAMNDQGGLTGKSVATGLHLVNFHPVQYLKSLDSENFQILAIARSRYNITNVKDRLDSTLAQVGVGSKSETEGLFRSADVDPGQKVAPFRVEIVWTKKPKDGDAAAVASANQANTSLLKTLLIRAYSAPNKYKDDALYRELNEVLDMQQLFRFVALNSLIRNGDFSDEFFWYVKKDQAGKTRLGILPQDGDDMFKGVHMFPFTPRQISLILKGKLGMDPGYVFNFEDPLFRVIRSNDYVYFQYLSVYQKMAKSLTSSASVQNIYATLADQIKPYASDPEVLARGRTDERGEAYTAESLLGRIDQLKQLISLQAERALGKLTPGALVGDLLRVQRQAEKKSSPVQSQAEPVEISTP